jgi:hypothetical protein
MNKEKLAKMSLKTFFLTMKKVLFHHNTCTSKYCDPPKYFSIQKCFQTYLDLKEMQTENCNNSIIVIQFGIIDMVIKHYIIAWIITNHNPLDIDIWGNHSLYPFFPDIYIHEHVHHQAFMRKTIFSDFKILLSLLSAFPI